MKKILVISSSLRHDSNSDALAEAFAKGAAEAGNEVESITLKGKNLHFCTGCLACQKTQKCVIADDAPAIVNKMYAADVIAFATPIYYYGMSGQLKTLLDRANPLFTTDYHSGTYISSALRPKRILRLRNAQLPDSEDGSSALRTRGWQGPFSPGA